MHYLLIIVTMSCACRANHAVPLLSVLPLQHSRQSPLIGDSLASLLRLGAQQGSCPVGKALA